ncbi:uncharacterized protein TNCV_659111 [Trichonephila clavipes]|nr:uncharacterized protein TNCV_659111 [Trichonephila clavipes]
MEHDTESAMAEMTNLFHSLFPLVPEHTHFFWKSNQLGAATVHRTAWNIKFCQCLGKTTIEILEMLSKVYDEPTMSRSKIYEWNLRFKQGGESIENHERVTRPLTSWNAENVALVSKCVRKDRRETLAQIAEGCLFELSDEMKAASQEVLREVGKSGSKLCFQKLYKLWQKCIVAKGDYFKEKLTVWCALWAGGIIGLYFFKNDEGHNVTVNGDWYRAMITNFFIPELNNHDVQELWFQQDGATCHTARATIDLLKDTFGDCLNSRFGPVNWPPRSCDLTPLDYFLWGYVKSLVYADTPQTLDHLEDIIRRVIADIRPQMLEKVIENWTSRLDYIRASRGSHMPEIIFKIIAACVDRDLMTVSRIWKRRFQDGNIACRAVPQRSPITSSPEDRHATRMALMNLVPMSRALSQELGSFPRQQMFPRIDRRRL